MVKYYMVAEDEDFLFETWEEAMEEVNNLFPHVDEEYRPFLIVEIYRDY